MKKGKDINNLENQVIYNNNRYWLTLNWPLKVRLFPVNNELFVSINKIEIIIYYIIVFLLVSGFIAYGGEIHDTVRRSKDLTWIDVITDTSICKLKNRKNFWHYVKLGLGIKL